MGLEDEQKRRELSSKLHCRMYSGQSDSFRSLKKALGDPLQESEERDMRRMCLYTEAVLREEIFLADAFAILDYILYKDELPELPAVDSLYNDVSFLAATGEGGSEGIYLDIYMETFVSRNEYTNDITVKRTKICTMKTLREDAEAYAIIGKLAGIIPTAYRIYIQENR